MRQTSRNSLISSFTLVSSAHPMVDCRESIPPVHSFLPAESRLNGPPFHLSRISPHVAASRSPQFCEGWRSGLLGLSLADLLRAEPRRTSAAGRQTSVIILWMRGGPSHHRHVGPQAGRPGRVPRRVRHHPHATCPASGSPTCCRCAARIMDKWSIVRSLHHHDAGHSTGDQICFTGYNAGPEPGREHPTRSCGSIVSKQLGHLTPAPAGLCDDPAHGARHRLGVSRRGAQAVRDAGRPGATRAVPACRTSRCPRA